MNRVVVTGIGLITALGTGIEKAGKNSSWGNRSRKNRII